MPSDGGPASDLQAEFARVVDRLRTLPLVRLEQRAGDASTPVQAARQVAQRVADAAAAVGGERVRALPALAVSATGDQLAVVGADLLAALAQRPDDAVTHQALAELRELRRRL